MVKGKLKLSVIDDYILLTKLNCNFGLWAQTGSLHWVDICGLAKEIAMQQLVVCRQIIFRLGLMDYAFAYLSSQLNAAIIFKSNTQKFNVAAEQIIENLKGLKRVKDRLQQLVKKLKFTTAEAAYLGV